MKQYIFDYNTNPLHSKSFIELAKTIFGIDFGPWQHDGYWTDRYICHSFSKNGQIISNVSVSKLQWQVNDRTFSTLQIGTVMTHPDYRGQGLAKELMQRVMEQYQNELDLIYLFANTDSASFYPQFGFTPIQETLFSLPVELVLPAKNPLRKISITNTQDKQIIDRLLNSRTPLSSIFRVEKAMHINAFYCYNIFNNCLYYDADQDVMIIYEQDGPALEIYDLISDHHIDFMQLLPGLPQSETTEINFYFTPDNLGLPITRSVLNTPDIFYIKGGTLPTDLSFKYPVTAQA